MTRPRGKTEQQHATSARLAYEFGIWPPGRPEPKDVLPLQPINRRTTSTGPGSGPIKHQNGVLTVKGKLALEELRELRNAFDHKLAVLPPGATVQSLPRNKRRVLKNVPAGTCLGALGLKQDFYCCACNVTHYQLPRMRTGCSA